MFLLGILLFILNLHADYPIHVDVTTIGGTSFYQGTHFTLETQPTGRLKTSNIKAMAVSPDCGDLLANFQKRPLMVMLQNGYISQKAYNDLMMRLKNDLDPRQLLLMTQYSEVPFDDIPKIFGPQGLPKDRYLGMSRDGIVKISRGTIYAVRGQILDVDNQGKVALSPRTLPWELDRPLGSGLTRPLDRSKILASVEIGRAHRESGPLKGDFKMATQLLFQTLATEFYFQNIPLEKVLVTAHFLDAAHTQFFTTRYPLRPLTPELAKALEEQPDVVMKEYLKEKLPEDEIGWKKLENTVAFGTLGNLVATGNVEDISQTAIDIVGLSGGKLKADYALKLVPKLVGNLRVDFDYFYQGKMVRKPIMIRDRGTAFGTFDLVRSVKAKEAALTEKESQDVLDYIGRLPLNSEPDSYSEAFYDKAYFIRKEKSGKWYKPSIEVANLDPFLATQFPVEYVASVILSVVDYYRSRIESTSTWEYAELRKWMLNVRKNHNQSVVSDVTVENLLDTYPLTFMSSDPGIQTQLRMLGGKPVDAIAHEVLFEPEKRRISIGQKLDVIYEFSVKDLQVISAQFPELANSGKQRMRQGFHSVRMKMLQSAYK